MKLSKILIALTLAFSQVVLSFSFINCSAISSSIDENINTSFVNAIDYLKSKQSSKGAWIFNNSDFTPEINNTLEYIYNSDILINMFEVEEEILNISLNSENFMRSYKVNNIDILSHYLLTDNFQSKYNVNLLLVYQNPDGDFGLAEGYTSDIIDTKLALKALADLGETEAMTKAAIYIASLQNDDGGFSYQQGLASNPELTAEIADIFGDCIINDPSLTYTLSDTLGNLNGYLDENMPEIADLSKDNPFRE